MKNKKRKQTIILLQGIRKISLPLEYVYQSNYYRDFNHTIY